MKLSKILNNRIASFLLAALLFAAIASIGVNAQKAGKTPTLWEEEHSGVPYSTQDVHFVLPAVVIDARGVTHYINPAVVGQPRPARVIRVFAERNQSTGKSNDIDAKVDLAPGDTADNFDELWLARIPASGPRQLGHWSHVPDPKGHKVLGR
jgi:hypothetical protein